MKRTIAVLLVLVAIAVWQVPKVLKGIFQDSLAKSLQMDVQIGEVGVRPTSLILYNVTILDSSSDTDMKVDEVTFSLYPWDFFRSPVPIQRITLNHVQLKSRLGVIKLKSVKNLLQAAKLIKVPQQTAVAGKSFVVDKLVADDIHLNVHSIAVTIPHLEFNDLSNHDAMTSKQLLSQIANELINLNF